MDQFSPLSSFYYINSSPEKYCLVMEKEFKKDPKKIFHERQSLLYCGMHAVNNILQTQAYTRKDMEGICKELHQSKGVLSINPHKSIFGVGNYDVNVLIFALNKYQYDMSWFDSRKTVEEIELEADELVGFIVNWGGKKSFWDKFFPSFNHWYSIRKIDGIYYNLDSKNSYVEIFRDYDELRKHLRFVIKNNAHVFLVRQII